jgi:hypothetical protein
MPILIWPSILSAKVEIPIIVIYLRICRCLPLVNEPKCSDNDVPGMHQADFDFDFVYQIEQNKDRTFWIAFDQFFVALWSASRAVDQTRLKSYLCRLRYSIEKMLRIISKLSFLSKKSMLWVIRHLHGENRCLGTSESHDLLTFVKTSRHKQRKKRCYRIWQLCAILLQDWMFWLCQNMDSGNLLIDLLSHISLRDAVAWSTWSEEQEIQRRGHEEPHVEQIFLNNKHAL